VIESGSVAAGPGFGQLRLARLGCILGFPRWCDKEPAMATLSRKDIDAFTRRLQERRRELIAEIRHEMEGGEGESAARLRDEYDSLDPHDDRAMGDWVRDVGMAQAARETAELQAVEAALKRIADETYGECIDCGEMIARARLEANPAAARCIGCQQRAERRAGGIKTSL
jgi:DnaK suppressor protein